MGIPFLADTTHVGWEKICAMVKLVGLVIPPIADFTGFLTTVGWPAATKTYGLIMAHMGRDRIFSGLFLLGNLCLVWKFKRKNHLFMGHLQKGNHSSKHGRFGDAHSIITQLLSWCSLFSGVGPVLKHVQWWVLAVSLNAVRICWHSRVIGDA